MLSVSNVSDLQNKLLHKKLQQYQSEYKNGIEIFRVNWVSKYEMCSYFPTLNHFVESLRSWSAQNRNIAVFAYYNKEPSVSGVWWKLRLEKYSRHPPWIFVEYLDDCLLLCMLIIFFCDELQSRISITISVSLKWNISKTVMQLFSVDSFPFISSWLQF